ncbi:hypothetical protein C8R44DRAFT_865164 [Mycena epipterygia]|nr:hypothetical protein C8R44DRAFT_865164 [Mycena epipterygia]
MVGFQILAGIETEFGMQNSLLVLQVEFVDTRMLIGQAASICSFTQESLLPSFLGRTLALSIAEPDFSSQLSKHLRQYAPDAPLSIVQQSPTSIYTQVMVPSMLTSLS